MALAVVTAVTLTACTSGSDEGAKGCKIYQAAMKDDPEAIKDVVALDEIKPMISKMDGATKAAFAGLVTAADENPFMPGYDPSTLDNAAATVRTTCLAQHGTEIQGP